MKIKVTKVIEREITRCYHQCPYFNTDMDGMFCEHPSIGPNQWDVRIISHPDCDTGFPKKCPLVLGLEAR